MPIVSLTKRFLSSVKPQHQMVTFWDKNIKGLILRLHPTGRKSFYSVFHLNGVRTFRFIGTYPTISPDIAKQIVRDDIIKSFHVTIQRDQRKTKQSKTFKHYMDQYINEHIQYLKDKTKVSYMSLLKVHIMPVFQNMQIKDITHRDITRFKNTLIHMTTTYNRSHEVISSFFNWCVTNKILSVNPIKNVKKYKLNKRNGHFSNIQYQDFIQSIYSLLTDGRLSKSAASCITFIALTGCRLNEALTCRWSYVDVANNTIQLPDSKTGAKTLYIGRALKTLLQSLPKNNDYIFPGRWGHGHLVNINKPFKMILQHANIKEKFSIHHLRHSYISVAANGGIPINAVQLTVGHASQSTTERYTHTDQKLAHQTAQAVENLITGQSGADLDGIIQSMP